MEEKVIFNAQNIMSDAYAPIWTELINNIQDSFIKRTYIQEIDKHDIREDVLRKVADISEECHTMPISFKIFITNLSFDIFFGPEWYDLFLEYYKNDNALPTSIMYPKMLKYASVKDIPAEEFFKIITSSEDYYIIEGNLSNYNSAQCEIFALQEDKMQINTEASVYDALLKVLSITDSYKESEEIDNINKMLSSQKTLTDDISLSVKNLVDILNKQKEDIKRLSLTAAAKDELIKSIQTQNEMQASEISALKEKLITYEKKELSRINLTHKLAEFSGLINEIDKTNIITAN